MKKICSVLLTLVLIIGFVTPIASAETYTVTIDINGGRNNLGMSNTFELEAMENVELIAVPKLYVSPPSGKELDAYEINGVRYEIGSLYTLNSDVTLKALWKTKGTQVMVIDLNGGESSTITRDNEFAQNTQVTLNFVAQNNVTPPKGKEFDAYEIDGVRYEAGSTYTVTKTFTVKVLWKDAPPTVVYGDSDGNNVVDATDALKVLQASVGKISLTDEQILALDVDGSKVIDALDALQILQYTVNKITIFPVEA